MLALEQARSPGLDVGEGPLAEVGYGSRGDRRAPKELGDVLDAPDGGPGRRISTMASSTLVSCLRQHSITTVWKVAPRGFGTPGST